MLNKHVRSEVAAKWHDLGVQLLSDKYVRQLEIIRENNPTEVEARCTAMFEYWLQVETTANWSKLIKALREINQHNLAKNICNDVLQGNSTYCIVQNVDGGNFDGY